MPRSASAGRLPPPPGVGHHRLRGHPLHRWHRPGRPDLQHHGHHRHGHRPDQRHRLHLQGGGHQRGRHRDPVGGIHRRHPGHHAGGADRRHGHRGQSPRPLTWTAPATNGGSAITGYVVTPYITGVAQATQTFNTTATTDTVTGLTNGTAYTFTVAAINGVGTGTASTPVQLGHHRPPRRGRPPSGRRRRRPSRRPP